MFRALLGECGFAFRFKDFGDGFVHFGKSRLKRDGLFEVLCGQVGLTRLFECQPQIQAKFAGLGLELDQGFPDFRGGIVLALGGVDCS